MLAWRLGSCTVGRGGEVRADVDRADIDVEREPAAWAHVDRRRVDHVDLHGEQRAWRR